MRCANEKEYYLQAVKQSMLVMRSVFLKVCTEKSPEYDIEIGISKRSSSQRPAGFYNEYVIQDVLEASSLDLIDNPYPFLDGLINSLRGLSKTGESAKALIEYADMVIFLLLRHNVLNGTLYHYSISKQKDKCSIFSKNAITAFGRPEESDMLTQ